MAIVSKQSQKWFRKVRGTYALLAFLVSGYAIFAMSTHNFLKTLLVNFSLRRLATV